MDSLNGNNGRLWTPEQEMARHRAAELIRSAFQGSDDSINQMMQQLGAVMDSIVQIATHPEAKNLLEAITRVMPFVGMPIFARMCNAIRLAEQHPGVSVTFNFFAYSSGLQTKTELHLWEDLMEVADVEKRIAAQGAVGFGESSEPAPESSQP